MIRKLLAYLLITGLLIAAIIGYFIATKPQPIIFQGQLEAKVTHIGAKVPGRIDEIYVQEGQKVNIGTPLVRLGAPEIKAKLAQAEAGYQAVSAVADKAKEGARPQQIAMAKAQYERAKAGAEFAQKSWQRVSTLANEGLISKQKRDETYAQYKNALELRDAAREQYQMAQEGARKQDIKAAEAQAQSVAAQVDQAKIALNEATLQSPVSGEVSKVIPDVGEIVGQGVPMVNVVDLTQQKLIINIREDSISHFALGNTFTGTIPALNNRRVHFKVYASAVMPDFAIWRPTRNNDGYDMRTFEVQARPEQLIDGMRPGMSVLVNLADCDDNKQ